MQHGYSHKSLCSTLLACWQSLDAWLAAGRSRGFGAYLLTDRGIIILVRSSWRCIDRVINSEVHLDFSITLLGTGTCPMTDMTICCQVGLLATAMVDFLSCVC